ncbi:hypothetical protein V6N11_025997 [Hibiscus sabdariffa]|uniref:Uncharacterized protein n=1 Tax=Hibiscus sabdariffa TaxID=183260 RepID=A0ABR2SUD1_9ROSI
MQGVSASHVKSHPGYPVTSLPGFYPSEGVQGASPRVSNSIPTVNHGFPSSTTPTCFSSSAGGVSTSSNNVGFASDSSKSVDAIWFPFVVSLSQDNHTRVVTYVPLNALHSDTLKHIISQGDVPVTNEEVGLH